MSRPCCPAPSPSPLPPGTWGHCCACPLAVTMCLQRGQADRLRNILLVSGVSWVIRYCRRDPATLADKGFSRWLTGKEAICQCRRCRGLGFDPWVGKISWERKHQPAPAFLPGKPHGQRSLVDCSPWGCEKSRTRLSGLAPVLTDTRTDGLPPWGPLPGGWQR